MNTVPTPTTATQRSACASWCHTHGDEGGVCLGETAIIDLSGTPGFLIDELSVGLGACAEDGTTITLGVNGYGYETTVDGAERFANAILDQVLAAKTAAIVTAPAAPAIPGPRREPHISVLAEAEPFGDTPGLLILLVDHGDRTALLLCDDKGSFTRSVELADWPAVAVQIMKAHGASKGGAR